MRVRGRVDELRGDADLSARLRDRCQHHPLDEQFLGDIPEDLAPALVEHRGDAGDHADAGMLRQLGDQRFGHRVGEGVLVHPVREVRNR